MEKEKRVYKLVLTGGPCGGKTTGQSRLCTFFENLGWKVFRVPETATVLLSGGVKFSDLTEVEDDLAHAGSHTGESSQNDSHKDSHKAQINNYMDQYYELRRNSSHSNINSKESSPNLSEDGSQKMNIEDDFDKMRFKNQKKDSLNNCGVNDSIRKDVRINHNDECGPNIYSNNSDKLVTGNIDSQNESKMTSSQNGESGPNIDNFKRDNKYVISNTVSQKQSKLTSSQNDENCPNKDGMDNDNIDVETGNIDSQNQSKMTSYQNNENGLNKYGINNDNIDVKTGNIDSQNQSKMTSSQNDENGLNIESSTINNFGKNEQKSSINISKNSQIGSSKNCVNEQNDNSIDYPECKNKEQKNDNQIFDYNLECDCLHCSQNHDNTFDLEYNFDVSQQCSKIDNFDSNGSHKNSTMTDICEKDANCTGCPKCDITIVVENYDSKKNKIRLRNSKKGGGRNSNDNNSDCVGSQKCSNSKNMTPSRKSPKDNIKKDNYKPSPNKEFGSHDGNSKNYDLSTNPKLYSHKHDQSKNVSHIASQNLLTVRKSRSPIRRSSSSNEKHFSVSQNNSSRDNSQKENLKLPKISLRRHSYNTTSKKSQNLRHFEAQKTQLSPKTTKNESRNDGNSSENDLGPQNETRSLKKQKQTDIVVNPSSVYSNQFGSQKHENSPNINGLGQEGSNNSANFNCEKRHNRHSPDNAEEQNMTQTNFSRNESKKHNSPNKTDLGQEFSQIPDNSTNFTQKLLNNDNKYNKGQQNKKQRSVSENGSNKHDNSPNKTYLGQEFSHIRDNCTNFAQKQLNNDKKYDKEQENNKQGYVNEKGSNKHNNSPNKTNLGLEFSHKQDSITNFAERLFYNDTSYDKRQENKKQGHVSENCSNKHNNSPNRIDLGEEHSPIPENRPNFVQKQLNKKQLSDKVQRNEMQGSANQNASQIEDYSSKKSNLELEKDSQFKSNSTKVILCPNSTYKLTKNKSKLIQCTGKVNLSNYPSFENRQIENELNLSQNSGDVDCSNSLNKDKQNKNRPEDREVMVEDCISPNFENSLTETNFKRQSVFNLDYSPNKEDKQYKNEPELGYCISLNCENSSTETETETILKQQSGFNLDHSTCLNKEYKQYKNEPELGYCISLNSENSLTETNHKRQLGLNLDHSTCPNKEEKQHKNEPELGYCITPNSEYSLTEKETNFNRQSSFNLGYSSCPNKQDEQNINEHKLRQVFSGNVECFVSSNYENRITEKEPNIKRQFGGQVGLNTTPNSGNEKPDKEPKLSSSKIDHTINPNSDRLTDKDNTRRQSGVKVGLTITPNSVNEQPDKETFRLSSVKVESSTSSDKSDLRRYSSLKVDPTVGVRRRSSPKEPEHSGIRRHSSHRVFKKQSGSEAFKFQENLLRTMVQIENTFFELGQSCSRNCLIICDRGAMDASAFISKEQWDKMMKNNNWNNVELRDNRYNQIIHMVSAAKGAEQFYSTEDHACRSEGMEMARELDYNAAAAWVGHPYFDVIDNSTDFEGKMRRMIECVCMKLCINTGDRLLTGSRKHKFLVQGPLPTDSAFPTFQDFDVIHNYLQSNSPNQVRLRKRGQKGHFSYCHTIRRPKQFGQVVEVKTQITHRDYLNLLSQKDDSHFTIYKKRRCFLINNQYFQLDIYKEPGHPRCKGLILLETYSAMDELSLQTRLPSFLTIKKEVTGNPDYSMFNLSLREDWKNSKKFCKSFQGPVTTNGHANGHDSKINGSHEPEKKPEQEEPMKINGIHNSIQTVCKV